METCCNGCNPMCKGLKLAGLGAALLFNEIYLQYNGWLLFGSLLILAGISKVVMGECICRKIYGSGHIEQDKKNEKPKKKHR